MRCACSESIYLLPPGLSDGVFILFYPFHLLDALGLVAYKVKCLHQCICSLQVLHRRRIWRRFTLSLENSVLYFQMRREHFANFLILQRKHLDIISSVVGMALKLKSLLLQRNGGGMCEFPFTLSFIINWQVCFLSLTFVIFFKSTPNV